MHLASQATYIGQRVLVEGDFRLLGVPTDPMVVRCIIRSPTGVLNTLIYPSTALTRRDLGLFEAAVLVDEAGTWAFRMEGAGIVDAVEEHLHAVTASQVL